MSQSVAAEHHYDDLTITLDEAELIDALIQQGWWSRQNCVSSEFSEALANEALTLYQNQKMAPAGIGRDQHFQQNATIRQDFIHWLDGASEIQRRYLSFMESIKQTLNRALFLGLFEFEAHFAIYPPGAFYKKHVDSFRGGGNRVVSVVTYLNADWPETGGGALAIYAPETEQIVQTVRPEAGTLVIFLSEAIPHEVLISHQQRASIAGWFRVNAFV